MKQYDVWCVALDPTIGKQMKKTRPCIIVSPDEMNQYLGAIVIQLLTSTLRIYPSRIKYELKGKACTIALDQVETIDKGRLRNKISQLEPKTIKQIKQTIEEIFCK